MRAHRHRRRHDLVGCGGAEELPELALELVLLVVDERNDIAENVERGDPGIARARDGLHRRDENFSDSKTLMNGRQRQRGDDRCAVAVGNDATAPASIATLSPTRYDVAYWTFPSPETVEGRSLIRRSSFAEDTPLILTGAAGSR